MNNEQVANDMIFFMTFFSAVSSSPSRFLSRWRLRNPWRQWRIEPCFVHARRRGSWLSHRQVRPGWWILMLSLLLVCALYLCLYSRWGECSQSIIVSGWIYSGFSLHLAQSSVRLFSLPSKFLTGSSTLETRMEIGGMLSGELFCIPYVCFSFPLCLS